MNRRACPTNPRTKHVLLAVLWFCAAPVMAQTIGFAVNSDSVDGDDQARDSLYRIELETGTATRIGNTVFQDIETLDFNTLNQLFGIDDASNTLVRLDPLTGNATPLGNQTNNLGLPATTAFDFGLSFVCGSDQPLVVSDNTRQVFRLDLPGSARASEIGNAGVSITGLASRVIDGEFRLYGIGSGDVAPNLYRIDPAALTVDLIGPLGDVGAYTDAGLAFDSGGKLWAITDRTGVNGQNFPSQILQIDPATGAAAVVAETITGIESLAITALDCRGIRDGSDEGGGDEGDDPTGDEPPPDETEPEGVPVLQPAGVVALALLLALLGMTRTARRRL